MKTFYRALLPLFLLRTLCADPPGHNDSTFPDPESQANSLRTPYMMQPIAPVQVGHIGRLSSIPEPAGSAAVYNTLFPYFKQNLSTAQDTAAHFNYTSWESQAPAPSTNPFSYQNNSGSTQVNIYFVDQQSSIRNALGVVDKTSLPTLGNQPLENLKNQDSLVFPYIQDAAAFTPTTGWGGSGYGRFVNTQNPRKASMEHPLLLSDAVSFTLARGEQMYFFLATNIGDTSTDSLDPSNPSNWSSMQNTWVSDPQYNYSPDTAAGTNFQHFKFYSINLDLPGTTYLVAVNDQSATSGGSQNQDYNDLFFIVNFVPGMPEPSTYIMLGTLLVLVFAWKRKKTQSVKNS